MAAFHTFARSESPVQSADVLTQVHTSSAEFGARSDTLNQELQQIMMMEIGSAVEAQQAKPAQLQPKTAAVQKQRGAKHAKHVGASCKERGRRSAANQVQSKDNAAASGQGQGHPLGQGQGQRPQGASLGKLLPFDSLQVSSLAFSAALVNEEGCICSMRTIYRDKNGRANKEGSKVGIPYPLSLLLGQKLNPSAKLYSALPADT